MTRSQSQRNTTSCGQNYGMLQLDVLTVAGTDVIQKAEEWAFGAVWQIFAVCYDRKKIIHVFSSENLDHIPVESIIKVMVYCGTYLTKIKENIQFKE